MSRSAALSPWWLIGFWAIIAGIGAVFAAAAILDWWETGIRRRARQASRERHPSIAGDLLSVVADVDRQFRDRLLPDGPVVTPAGAFPLAPAGGDLFRKRPVDLVRDDIIDGGDRVLDRGWPTVGGLFVVPTVGVDGRYGQRSWPMDTARRFDTVRVTR